MRGWQRRNFPILAGNVFGFRVIIPTSVVKNRGSLRGIFIFLQPLMCQTVGASSPNRCSVWRLGCLFTARNAGP